MSELPDAVSESLARAFPDAPISDMTPLRGGMSGARMFAVTVAGDAYVVRHVPVGWGGRPPDFVSELACAQIASDRGIAPALVFGDAERRVSISRRILGGSLAERLFSTRAPATDADALQLGELLRRLHDGPAFPRTASAADTSDGIARHRGREPEPHVAEIRDALAPHVAPAPCHHDMNPSNILLEASEASRGRMWLVDWDAAAMGDPFHDLAAAGVFVFRDGATRRRLLEAYLGRPPSATDDAHLLLARVLALTLYANVFAVVAATPRAAPPDPAAPLPYSDPAAFGRSLENEARELLRGDAYRDALALLRGT